MANNQAQDRYNPQGVSEDDWEPAKYADLSEGAIFWLNTERNDSNEAYRKLDEGSCMNTKNQIKLDVLSNIDVFVKI